MNNFEVDQYEAGGANATKTELANDFEAPKDATTQPTTAAQNDAATSQTNNGGAQNGVAPSQTNNDATQNGGAPSQTTEATAAENDQFMAGLKPDPNANAGRGRKPSTISPPRITKVTPPAWNLGKAATTPTTPTTPKTPPKPRLTVTLALDASMVSEVAPKKIRIYDDDISTFWTKTLPKQRLNNPKVKENYCDDLDLGALLRQTVAPTSEFQFSLVDVDPSFKDYNLSCALEKDVLVVEGVPTQPFDGEIELKLQYRCYEIHEYQRRVTVPPLGLNPNPNPNVNTTHKHFAETSGSTEPCRLPFTIHQDSWDLWKVVEPPKDAPYPTPHSDNFAAPLPGSDKFLLVASQRGRSHEHDGKFRDDSFAVNLDAVDGWSFFAVGDGAGSAKFSRKGSEIACRTIVESLATLFTEHAAKVAPEINRLRAEAAQTPERAFLDGNDAPDVVPKIFIDALYNYSFNAIHKEVGKRNQNREPDEKEAQLRDYHTTLLCGALKKFDDGWALLSYWIGDGGFALYRPNGENRALALGKPDGGEFAGQTRFFTMPEEITALAAVQNRVRVSFVSDFDALALATDGVSDPYFETENDLGAFEAWQKFWQARQKDEIFRGVFDANLEPTERAERLTQGLRFKIKGHHDDRTLLLVLNPDAFVDSSSESSEPPAPGETPQPETVPVAPPQPETVPSENNQSPKGEN